MTSYEAMKAARETALKSSRTTVERISGGKAVTSDLVERLRDWASRGNTPYDLCFDAADEIERLRAALEQIIREVQGAGNKGPIAAELARRALEGR